MPKNESSSTGSKTQIVNGPQVSTVAQQKQIQVFKIFYRNYN